MGFRHTLLLFAAAITGCGLGASAQIASSVKITEVVTGNPAGLVDECGHRPAWIEIRNTSWGTVNLRGNYLTADRRAADPGLTVTERVALMSPVPPGDGRTSLKAQETAVFFADGRPSLGTFHTNFRLKAGEANFIALFDGDGHTLLDSVTVPAALPTGCSYARFPAIGGEGMTWKVVAPENVTPDAPNSGAGMTADKVAEFKRHDPHGFGMAILGISIVFLCLLLLAVFFTVFGRMFSAAGGKAAAERKPLAGSGAGENDGDAIAAVIALALSGAIPEAHDKESGVITIRPRHSNWTRTGGAK